MSSRPQPPLAAAAAGRAGGQTTTAAASRNGASSAAGAITATDVYASSIAIPAAAMVARVERQLGELAVQRAEFVQRDVVCGRTDDDDDERKQIEQDAMYAPVRKARLQSRLQVRFENGRIELRLRSKPAGKMQQGLGDLYNLIRIPLDVQAHRSAAQKRLSSEIDAGRGEWQQVIQAMGWKAKHETIRQGQRFVLRDDAHCRTEAILFRLCKLEGPPASASLRPISDTQILQVTAVLPLVASGVRNADNAERDASQLSKIALTELEAVQKALDGLVQLSKEEAS